jgi:hypothetical protein
MFSMLGPRIESFGIQRRRAVNAHQGALRFSGAGSVACDSHAPLTHVKATTALLRHRTRVSTASNEAIVRARQDSRLSDCTLRLVKPVFAPLLRFRGVPSAARCYMRRINRTEIP